MERPAAGGQAALVTDSRHSVAQTAAFLDGSAGTPGAQAAGADATGDDSDSAEPSVAAGAQAAEPGQVEPDDDEADAAAQLQDPSHASAADASAAGAGASAARSAWQEEKEEEEEEGASREGDDSQEGTDVDPELLDSAQVTGDESVAYNDAAATAAEAATEQEAEQPEAEQQGGEKGGEQAAQASAEGGGGTMLPLSARETALRGCKTLECVREAHKQPKHEQQFNFPHFLILGFPKTATTSLYHHLIQHPSIMAPRVKEPNFFTTSCQGDVLTCSLGEQERYITETLHLGLALQARLFMATFEASVHYSWAGEWLAPQLGQLMPWLKLVISMREPISQAISMLKHNLDHNRNPACYTPGASVFKCLAKKLGNEEEGFTPRLQAWLEAFPPEQLFVLQYENLTDASKTKGALRDFKRFVGIATKLPHNDLGLHNSRKSDKGWPMTRSEYEQLVALARRDADGVAEIVRRHGFADADCWRSNWEKAWQRNLNACGRGPDGACIVQLT